METAVYAVSVAVSLVGGGVGVWLLGMAGWMVLEDLWGVSDG